MVVVVEFTQAWPSQYCPDGQVVVVVVVVELTQEVPFQVCPVGQELTQAVPFQVCPGEQVVVVVVVVVLGQSLGHDPELSPESHTLLLLHAVVVVVEVTHAVPLQYWPDGQVVEVVVVVP